MQFARASSFGICNFVQLYSRIRIEMAQNSLSIMLYFGFPRFGLERMYEVAAVWWWAMTFEPRGSEWIRGEGRLRGSDSLFQIIARCFSYLLFYTYLGCIYMIRINRP